jgi:hypothetical protein
MLGMVISGLLWCGALAPLGIGYYWQEPGLTKLGWTVMLMVALLHLACGAPPFRWVHRLLDRLFTSSCKGDA